VGTEKEDEGKLVLIVDDDENLLFNLGAFLESQGFRTIRARGVQEGLDAFFGEKIDAALVDYRLVGRRGTEFVWEVRRRMPDFPIIMMTAYYDEWVEVMIKSCSPLTCLTKPFKSEDLLRALEEALQERTKD
jgi:DNA-binding NtrC family response regulator